MKKLSVLKRRILEVTFVFLVVCSRMPLAAAALVSLEHGQKNAAAEQLAAAGSVLCSKETEQVSAPYVIRQQTDKAAGVLVSNEDQGFTGTFIVRQQAQQAGAVFIAKPQGLDLHIVRLMSGKRLQSVEDYAAWLQSNFVYKPDEGGDIWALPEETLAREYGDCEDFAFLNAAVLRVFNYKPLVLGLGGGRHACHHAICAFKKDGEYFWFDNTTLKKTTAASCEEFTRRVLADQGYAYCYEINPAKVKERVLSDDSP